MRGSPILRAVLVFVALLALAPLLWKLTRVGAVSVAVQDVIKESAEPVQVPIELKFSFPANKVVIMHLGKEIWSKTDTEFEEAAVLQLPWPKEGVELRIVVAWGAGNPGSAMRIRLTAPDITEYERTVWGGVSADEVLKFP